MPNHPVSIIHIGHMNTSNKPLNMLIMKPPSPNMPNIMDLLLRVMWSNRLDEGSRTAAAYPAERSNSLDA